MNNVKVTGIKITFLGTPEFAVPILEKLANSGYKPTAVFCAPDKPVGRKQTLTPPPVKLAAQKHNIPIFQPKDKKELLNYLNKLPFCHSGLDPESITPQTYKAVDSRLRGNDNDLDLIISAAYGMILPQEVLEIPKYSCLNVHPSLLPKYRGPSPIQNAILNGDAETGVTIMKMAIDVDAGPIVAQSVYSLSEVEGSKITTPELSQKLSLLGADLLLKTLPDYLLGKIIPQTQNESKATFTKIIKKEGGRIDWRNSAASIERQIRAYTPWPGAYSYYSSSPSTNSGLTKVEKFQIKILEADIIETNIDKQIGQIFLTDNNQLAVQTGEGTLIIKKIQPAGGKPLITEKFLRGHQDIIGQKLN